MQLPNHGANPEQLTKKLNMKFPNDAIDFSVNTTPFALPQQMIDKWPTYINNIAKYPDPNSEQLKQMIAEKEFLSVDQLLIGNGAAQLIFLLAMYFRRKKVAIIEPTFSEYRDACRAFDCEIEAVTLIEPWNLHVEEVIEACKSKDVLFICNPNNPTGVAYSLEEIEYVVKKLEKDQVTVIVDEAFYDFQENGTTLISLVHAYSNVIVLRSMTKMYGIAGLRLGFMAAHPTLIEKISLLQNPWSVNGVAQQIGCDCLCEPDYVKTVQQFISTERKRLFLELEQLGFETSHSVVNFYLLKEKGKREDCLPLMKFLIENKIIPRHTYNFPTLDGKYLRLAIRTKEENNLLLQVLQRRQERC